MRLTDEAENPKAESWLAQWPTAWKSSDRDLFDTAFVKV